ncbi:MAG TPA: HAMP domain-containing sensor histidine kinase [Puia sp.]|nr:HAMP domain-containing sensor histidine kinase [Puia sp.]
MKLLHKSIRQLSQYALIVFIICVPLFYFIIEQLYIQDVDDALYLKRDELRLRAAHLQTDRDIDLWLHMDDDVKIALLRVRPARDSLYFTQYLDSIPQEIEPYRELVSSIVIGGKPYKLVVRASLVESRDLIIGIAEAQAVLLLLLLAGWVLILRITSRRTWKGFYATINKLRQYELDGGQVPAFEKTDVREFDDLNKAIGELIHRNQEVYASQKKFIENASHEMQTPLAIFRSKLDNMIESSSLSADTSRDYQVLYEAVQRLYHLNKGLLLLSKISNHQFDETKEIFIGEMIRQCVDFLREIIDRKAIDLRLDLPVDHTVRANETLLQVMLTNLLTNAIRHNHDNGAVFVSLEPARLTITNSGAALPFPQKELFTRFKKHSAPEKGIGLGLSIIKDIADKYEWPIKYVYAGSLHQFHLYFNNVKAVV